MCSSDLQAAITNQQKSGVGNCCSDGCCGFDQVIVSLEVEQSTDFAEYDVVFLQVQSLADFVARDGGLKKPVHVHTAVNGGEFFNRRNSCLYVLASHRITDRDEVRAPASGQFFSLSISEVQRGRLAEVEGCAVNRVDGRNSQLVCGESSEDPGF